jgi:hypothetical protein
MRTGIHKTPNHLSQSLAMDQQYNERRLSVDVVFAGKGDEETPPSIARFYFVAAEAAVSWIQEISI